MKKFTLLLMAFLNITADVAIAQDQPDATIATRQNATIPQITPQPNK